ncbi:MAG: hypothetical protein FWC26_04065 [Fibromonadales bacterium]|nr:hypothetical protein [Fibromonadales bacterium]
MRKAASGKLLVASGKWLVASGLIFLAACMQLDEIEAPTGGGTAQEESSSSSEFDNKNSSSSVLEEKSSSSLISQEKSSSSSVPKEESSSSLGGFKAKISEKKLDSTRISYYEAILICNKTSLAEGLDSLYQHDAPVFIDDSLFWLPNIKVLENRSGYRLPTKEEFILAEENKELKDVDISIGEWLYGASSSQYSVFELAPEFLKAVGLYREREGYPAYGMRVVKVSASN